MSVTIKSQEHLDDGGVAHIKRTIKKTSTNESTDELKKKIRLENPDIPWHQAKISVKPKGSLWQHEEQ